MLPSGFKITASLGIEGGYLFLLLLQIETIKEISPITKLKIIKSSCKVM